MCQIALSYKHIRRCSDYWLFSDKYAAKKSKGPIRNMNISHIEFNGNHTFGLSSTILTLQISCLVRIPFNKLCITGFKFHDPIIYTFKLNIAIDISLIWPNWHCTLRLLWCEMWLETAMRVSPLSFLSGTSTT